MSWTDERVEILTKMWAEGNSASQIAKELGGVTRNAVIGKAHRLNLSSKIKTRSLKQSQKVHDKTENNNLNFEENRLDFFRKLSANIASPYPERILKSKLILVTGTSGTGKTTMAAKIASSIVDKFGNAVSVTTTLNSNFGSKIR